ncbi:hypothetical protein B7494_g6109 [Chlorociboria aeruginascens]|nr:hypothetical protein B7494_g6109 [Chlorociboria aeruginascens]
MAQSKHTYGPSCHMSRGVAFSSSKGGNDIPYLKAHFFYCSPLHIDDPLSATPASSSSDSNTMKHPPRPFSAYDNKALEEAWLGLASDKFRKKHRKLGIAMPGSPQNSRDKKHAIEEGPSQSSVTPNSSKDPSGSTNSESRRNIRNERCECKGTHNKCKTPHGCGCAACPNASSAAIASSGANNSTFEDHNASGHNVMKTLKADNQAWQKSEAQGNPYNPHCEDPHHVPLDSKVPICCEELGPDGRNKNEAPFEGVFKPRECCPTDTDLGETTTKADSNETIQKGDEQDLKGKETPHTTACHSLAQCQGDATDENREEESRFPDDVPKESTFPEEQTKQHKIFEKHQHSKSHQSYEKHLKFDQAHTSEDHTAEPKVHRQKHSGRQKKKTSSDTQPSNPIVTAPTTQENDAGTTGLPFVKFPLPNDNPRSLDQSSDEEVKNQNQIDSLFSNITTSSPKDRQRDSSETIDVQECKAHKNKKEHVDVPVGISRLHHVDLPSLQMRPIYWLPIHDIAAVTRGTWFYKDNMYPVEPQVANQLEFGYRELRPWSNTWNDELDSAIEVGAAGEEKVAHRLWLKNEQKHEQNDAPEQVISADPYCAARCFHGEVAAEGTVAPERADDKPSDRATISKKYPNSQVIYKDAQNAFILKPSLQPSAYYGRRPLRKIRKGTSVGIHVIRGFDWKAWEKLYPQKKANVTIKAEANAPVAGDEDIGKRNTCLACRSQDERPKVTDLVFVIHGIGQKLSERVESFNFTHAVNEFRRHMNVELGNQSVRRVLRDDLGGVMVLPVNWRSTLSFEDGGSMKDGDQDNGSSATKFSMKDITPDTIPVVRNVISDVMLDIPFYMSHHKPKMIQAVITEANRVYRLWCKNNPHFHQEGHVHIIAHSLGSVMAAEILSKQPTSIPKVDFHGKKINMKHFDFNTTNLFFVGSPLAFFLFLEKSNLIPRREQHKPAAEQGDDTDKNVVGNAGTFGCMAVDNIYNIMNYNDPIAYRLNATVDATYASGMKIAQVPNATTSFLSSITNAMKSMTSDTAVGQVARPTASRRLPSQLEMEVHDFTREEIAEKKFYLLNDNGQVDWFLSSGGGPLEIQYLNMLGAHSSYWGSPDFVRMIVIEVGRQPGKQNALPNMKVVKVGHR